MVKFGLEKGVFSDSDCQMEVQYEKQCAASARKKTNKKNTRLETKFNFASCHLTLKLLQGFLPISLCYNSLTSDEDCCRLRRQTEEESTHEAACDNNVLLHKFCSL